MNQSLANTQTSFNRRLISIWALLLLSLTASAKPLLVGIDPTLDRPSPSFVETINGEQKKRFSKTQYQRIDGEDPHAIWRELITIISGKSRIELLYEPSSSQLDFELKLAKGRFDLAYMSPVQFVNGNQAGSYKALAKRKSQPAKGLIVALKDGPIKSLRDFEGKVVAFPGLLNFSSSIIPRRSLEQLNIHVKPHFTGSHLQAMQLVLNGAVLGAAGTQASIALLSPPQKDKLTIVWDTPSFTPHAFARHTRVPFYSQIRLQNALVGLIKTEQGKRLLPTIHINNGFETATDSDWEDVESIDIDSLNTKRSYPLPSAEQKQTSSELQ